MIEKWKKESLYEFMIHRKEGPHTVLFMVRECFNNIMILNKKEINLWLISLFTYFSKFVFLLFYLSQKNKFFEKIGIF